METLLCDEVYHYHHKMMFKEPRVGGAWAWHQDYGYWYDNGCLFPYLASCMIAVDRATKENGCLQVLSGSHHLGRINHVKIGDQTGADPERVAVAVERLEIGSLRAGAGFGHLLPLQRAASLGPEQERRSAVGVHLLLQRPRKRPVQRVAPPAVSARCQVARLHDPRNRAAAMGPHAAAGRVSASRAACHPLSNRADHAVKAEALRIGFDLVGIAPAMAPGGLDGFHNWLRKGYAGEMAWISRREDAYEHPRHVLPGVRSVIMLARNYRTDDPAPPCPGTGRVSRYAWSDADYHARCPRALAETGRFPACPTTGMPHACGRSTRRRCSSAISRGRPDSAGSAKTRC